MNAVDYANAEVRAGAREIGGNNQGPFVEKYLNVNHPGRITHTGEPWCVAFYLWCHVQAGPLLVEFTRSAHVLFERMAWTARCGAKVGADTCVLSTLRPGDALFWNFHVDSTDSPSHVNMLHHVGDDGTVWTIGGNEGDEESGAPVRVKARRDLGKLWGVGKFSVPAGTASV